MAHTDFATWTLGGQIERDREGRGFLLYIRSGREEIELWVATDISHFLSLLFSYIYILLVYNF